MTNRKLFLCIFIGALTGLGIDWLVREAFHRHATRIDGQYAEPDGPKKCRDPVYETPVPCEEKP